MRSPVTTSHYPLTTHTPLNTRQTSHRSSDAGKVSHSPAEEGGPPPKTGGGGGQPRLVSWVEVLVVWVVLV